MSTHRKGVLTRLHCSGTVLLNNSGGTSKIVFQSASLLCCLKLMIAHTVLMRVGLSQRTVLLHNVGEDGVG